jgi:hypothetical protein
MPTYCRRLASRCASPAPQRQATHSDGPTAVGTITPGFCSRQVLDRHRSRPGLPARQLWRPIQQSGEPACPAPVKGSPRAQNQPAEALRPGVSSTSRTHRVHDPTRDLLSGCTPAIIAPTGDLHLLCLLRFLTPAPGATSRSPAQRLVLRQEDEEPRSGQATAPSCSGWDKPSHQAAGARISHLNLS